MRSTQLWYDPGAGWASATSASEELRDAQIVLVLGDTAVIERPDLLPPLRQRFPDARIVLCSAGGQIAGDRVVDGAAVATALRLDFGTIHAIEQALPRQQDSEAVGEALARQLPPAGLRHVLVLSEGLAVNGSALAAGIVRGLPGGVSVSGGLAADGDRFARTLVGLDAPPTSGRVVAVGFYGRKLRVGLGSLGGWEAFGPRWLVTRAEGNVVFELDGQPALPLYKRLIGAHAYALPASGLLYPLHVESEGEAPGLTRTLLAIDESAQSLTFAGTVPTGRHAQPMRATLDRLIDAAGEAATASLTPLLGSTPEFVLLVSCIGRKLLLQQRAVEEVRSARAAFGPGATFAGFYSYGELSPHGTVTGCELHNQTMTITTLSEQ